MCFHIRKSPDHWLCAPTRSLSQLITSFIASVSLGIRHTPFLTFFTTVFAISLTWQRISSSYFQLYSNKVKSHLAIWFTLVWTKVHYLQFCLCQYVKDLLALKGMVEIVELNHFAWAIPIYYKCIRNPSLLYLTKQMVRTRREANFLSHVPKSP